MATPVITPKTKLKRGDGQTPEAFTSLGRVRNVNYQVSLDSADTTHFDSPEDATENTPTMLTVGDITAEFHFDPADNAHAQIAADQAAKRQCNWRVVHPTAQGHYFQVLAYPAQCQIVSNQKDVIVANLTLRASGPPTRGTES